MQSALVKTKSVRRACQQPALMGICVLVTGVCPVYLIVDELVLMCYGSLGANGSLLMFFLHGEYGFTFMKS